MHSIMQCQHLVFQCSHDVSSGTGCFVIPQVVFCALLSRNRCMRKQNHAGKMSNPVEQLKISCNAGCSECALLIGLHSPTFQPPQRMLDSEDVAIGWAKILSKLTLSLFGALRKLEYISKIAPTKKFIWISGLPVWC